MPRVISYTIEEKDSGIKIYTFLKYRNGFSTKLIRSLKNVENGIILNGEHARTVDMLSPCDILEVSIPDDDSEIEPVVTDLDIVYEDDDVLVINKSPLMAMHPSHNHQGDTLANAVSAHLKSIGKSSVFRAVGRLDKGTSGLVVCALNPLAACKLSGKVKKEYFAVVEAGIPDEGTVDIPIYRPDPLKTLRACSYELGNENAVTHWHVVSRTEEKAIIRLNLETGRTHQIRVHMASIGFPLAGDNMYGNFELRYGHQLLHCGVCRFIHPVTGENMEFKTDLPDEFFE